MLSILLKLKSSICLSTVPANLTNDAGNTLIMLASYAGHASLVRQLLERGKSGTAGLKTMST